MVTMRVKEQPPVQIKDNDFALCGRNSSYRFHVDKQGADLITDHFGGLSGEAIPVPDPSRSGWTQRIGRLRREYPDIGRGDFRSPAIHIRQADGSTVSQLKYHSSKTVKGKPALHGLSATYGTEDEVTTLVVTMKDELCGLEVELSYSIFPQLDAIVRSAKVTNNGKSEMVVEKAASLCVDLPYGEWEMLSLRGEWGREMSREKRKVDYGMQSFGSLKGYSSAAHNPFVAMLSPGTTETQGEVWAFNLVWTGSYLAEVEKGTDGTSRVMLGLHPLHLSYPLAPGASLVTPECIAVYSSQGLGQASRQLHRLQRYHLMRGPTALRDRTVLLNSWEGLYFDFDQDKILHMAKATADLGVKLFVLDDGWFGEKYPRVDDHAGLGDWVANPKRFPDGMPPFIEKVTDLTVKGTNDKLKFGLWVEPEMVNPKSKLYDDHPDWVMHCGNYPRTEARTQLVLNLSIPQVQDYIIDCLTKILSTAKISYIKWDNNRAFHEIPHPSVAYNYIVGLYRVLGTLTTRFPEVQWEGCASGGGRFDSGLLPYFPVSWTSDNTDGLDRIFIQFGTSVAYPPATMGCHVADVPSHSTGRTTPFEFRAHVAMMGGSFGYELNPANLSEEDQERVPKLAQLAEKVNPLVVRGDLYRLAIPDESNWPAAQYISEKGDEVVLFYFQMHDAPNQASRPPIRLQGLDPEGSYKEEGGETYSGATLMNSGLTYPLSGDYKSKLVFFAKV